MKTLDRIDRALARIEGWLIIALLWAMVVLTFVQVIFRSLYTHGHFLWANEMLGSLDWSGPLVQLLVLWLTLLGSSLLTREGKHIKIDLFGALLPPKWLPVRGFILAVVSVCIIGIMVKVCIDYVIMEMEFGGTSLFYLPSWVGQIILPLGFTLLFFRFLIKAIHEGTQVVRGLLK
ncbi:MAG: TRAP transporter small permease subunit [Deltaproteobacteria bacterium]|jgi:TRAP-type C4-dicarboxylate transport system permease small subunit|nr:TRAP transporter small permease subunit [Deltaproteobacteria bacterium]